MLHYTGGRASFAALSTRGAGRGALHRVIYAETHLRTTKGHGRSPSPMRNTCCRRRSLETVTSRLVALGEVHRPKYICKYSIDCGHTTVVPSPWRKHITIVLTFCVPRVD
ncbi:unnamed protein product [Pylaiella littoralis]